MVLVRYSYGVASTQAEHYWIYRRTEMQTNGYRISLFANLLILLVITTTALADEQSAEDLIRANIAQTVEAINSQDLEKYARLATVDLVNMTKYGIDGDLISTVGRQVRLDQLEANFANNPYTTTATMTPIEILAQGERGFARIDGSLRMTPKQSGDLKAHTMKLDLYLFYLKHGEHGWQTERSMAIVRSRSDA
jgi:ketosteroid isomerase-like protein